MVRTFTEKDIDAFEEYLGIKLLQCQREMLLRYLTSDKRSYIVNVPPRVAYLSRVRLALWCAIHGRDIAFIKQPTQTDRIVDGLCGRRFLIDPIDDAADPCTWPKVNPYIKKDGKNLQLFHEELWKREKDKKK